jgi:hypothetical protein
MPLPGVIIQQYLSLFLPTLSPHYIPHYLVLLVLLLYSYHFIVLRPSPGGPPLIRGPIPILGCALSFLLNPEQFLLQCQSQYGDIFTLYMGGRKLHIITDPVSAIPLVYRNYKQFPFSVLANHVDIILFGVKEKHAKDTILYKANLDRVAPNLLALEQVEKLLYVFNENLIPVLKRHVGPGICPAVRSDPTAGIEVDLDNWVRRVMFECSGKAMFGATWPEDDAFYEAFCGWDKGTYDIIKEYPWIFTRKAIQAREEYYRRLLKIFEEGLEGPSRLVLERVKVCFPPRPSVCTWQIHASAKLSALLIRRACLWCST